MSNNTVITRESWFSRLGGAFKGGLGGLLLVLAGIGCLWWNEGRAVLTAKGLAEGAGLVVSVPADRVDPANEGTLIHVSGRAQVTDSLADPDFPYMRVKGLLLRRSVEMFQWQEEQQTKETKQTGGSVVKETTYTYHKVWASRVHNSANFHDPNGHENPSSMPYTSRTLSASGARLGAFSLPGSMLELPTQEALRAPDNAAVAKGHTVANGQIYIGKNPGSPAVGDVRIQHAYAPEQDLSVVAQQRSGSFASFSVSNGRRSIQMLKPGLYDAGAMFSAARHENAVLTWLLRALGVVGLFAGFYCVLRPLAVLGDVIPMIGSILAAGAGLIAVCLSLASGLIVIGLAWLYYRPVLGIALLVGGGAVLLGGKWLVGRLRAQAAVPANAMPKVS